MVVIRLLIVSATRRAFRMPPARWRVAIVDFRDGLRVDFNPLQRYRLTSDQGMGLLRHYRVVETLARMRIPRNFPQSPYVTRIRIL
jgi:hypothetical protein